MRRFRALGWLTLALVLAGCRTHAFARPELEMPRKDAEALGLRITQDEVRVHHEDLYGGLRPAEAVRRR